jgi:hypothetical protein
VRIRFLAITFGAAIALATVVPAFADGGPTPGPVAGPGCFGLWRAGSVQVIDQGGGNAGLQYFSQRAGDNAQMNADARAQCAALTP